MTPSLVHVAPHARFNTLEKVLRCSGLEGREASGDSCLCVQGLEATERRVEEHAGRGGTGVGAPRD